MWKQKGLLDYQGRAGDHCHCTVEPSPGHIRCRKYGGGCGQNCVHIATFMAQYCDIGTLVAQYCETARLSQRYLRVPRYRVQGSQSERIGQATKSRGLSWGLQKRRKTLLWRLLDPRFEWLKNGLNLGPKS